MKLTKKLFILSITSILASCGGSSDSSSPSAVENKKNIKSEVVLNKPLTSNISSTEDTVYFNLNSVPSKNYTFNVKDLAINELNIYAQALDSEFNPISKEINILFGKTDAIDFKATSTSSYLSIRGSTGNRPFRFEVSALPNFRDGLVQDNTHFEPNNSFNTSKLVNKNNVIKTTLSRSDENDFYAIDVAENEKINVKLTNLDTYFAAPNVNYRIYDAQFEAISARKGVGSKSSDSIEISSSTATTFYVKVDTGGTPYNFNYSISFDSK